MAAKAAVAATLILGRLLPLPSSDDDDTTSVEIGAEPKRQQRDDEHVEAERRAERAALAHR